MKMKVLFLCKERIKYGSYYGLINSATLVSSYLNSKGIPSEVRKVVDGNGIDKEVYNYKPSHVIIELYGLHHLKWKNC